MSTIPMIVPAGVNTVLGLSGTTYTPDAFGVINVDYSTGDVLALLQSGCLAHPVLYQNFTAVAQPADTTEDTLFTYSLPASWLTTNGRGLKIRTWGVTLNNGNTKTMKLYFGSAVVATPGAATNAKGFHLELEVHRTGVSAQSVFGKGIVDTTAVTPYFLAATETETSAIVIKLTGQSGTGTANDISGKGFIVEALF